MSNQINCSDKLGETMADSAESSTASSSSSSCSSRRYPQGQDPQLRYCPPYYHPYRTSVKQRWIGRQILEVVSTEFRDRSVEYYRHALESGVTTVNGKTATPDQILRANDRIENTVHRHEPPITKAPLLVLHKDDERQFVVVSKPGSVPVHATGRYYKHTVLELLKADFDITAYSVNRLDRLTSGLMILALSGKAASRLAGEFVGGRVHKEYIARGRGRFPDGEITADQPLLTVDRQMGLVIVHPEGKEAKTIFTRMSYDAERDESVIHCRPITGRTHQIRVHLQYLGHPITNDPLYGTTEIWGDDIGKGGIDLTPDMSGMTDASKEDVADDPLASIEARMRGEPELGNATAPVKYHFKTAQELKELRERVRESLAKGGLPREQAEDRIVGGSPVYLSRQAREIVAKLRKQKVRRGVFNFSSLFFSRRHAMV